MFKRGLTIWNVLALGIALALGLAYPNALPRKHQYASNAAAPVAR